MEQRSEMSEKTRKRLAALAFVLFVLFMAALFYFVGRPLLRFFSDPEAFRAWVAAKGFWGKLLFVLMVAFQVIVAIVPGEPFEIGAGYAFGVVGGTLLCLAGTLIGSACVFLFVRRFGVRAVEVFFGKDKLRSLAFLQNTKRVNLLVFLIFLIPGTPKDLLTYFVGLTEMKFSHWLLISTLARLPSLITSTIGGDALGLQNYKGAIIAFSIAMAVSGVGFLVYRYLSRKRS